MSQNIVEVMGILSTPASREWTAAPDNLFGIPIHQENYPWILYYAKWFDPWLMFNSFLELNKTKPPIKTREVGDNVYRLRLNSRIKKEVRASLKRKHQFREQYWLAWHINEAAMAYDNLKMPRVVYIKRTPISVSIGDDELKLLLLGKKK
jgi:hypothetical protein